jgi:anti-sigma factor RsiW
MMDCDKFLAEYSEYRDGEVSWAEREEFEAHMDACEACARYDEVVRQGGQVLRSLPELEVSDDFMDRLKHRIYTEDLERKRAASRGTPGAVLATAAVAAGVSLFAWTPLMRPSERLVSLPAVAAEAPRQTLVRRLLDSTFHQEATTLTSRLAQIGVAVQEMPYHDVVFRAQGPVVGHLAVFASMDEPAPAGR